MEINFKRGLGDIKFGMKENEIIALLGEPNKNFLDEDNDQQMLYRYNNLQLTLTFYYESDGKLGYIRTTNPLIYYNNHRIIGNNITQLKENAFTEITDWDYDEYFSFDTYSADKFSCFWISLEVEYDKVTEFDFGIPFKNDEEYDWPTL